MNDRQKKLEEIRQRKLKLAAMLNTNQATTEDPSAQKSAEEIARAALEKSKKTTTVDLDEIKKRGSAFKDLMLRKFNESLGTTKFTETIVGFHPEVYDAEIQCKFNEKDEDLSSDEEAQPKPKQPIGTRRGSNLLAQGIFKLIQSKGKKMSQYGMEEQKKPRTDKPFTVVTEEMSKEYIDKKSEEVLEFICNKKKIVERALNENNVYDLLKPGNEEEEEIIDLSPKSMASPLVEFFDEQCLKRTVISLEWSLKHPELLLSAYSKADDFNLNQQNGLILLWSLSMRKVPEFVFTCQTEVTSSIFHKYNHKLVIGGTYTGQVLIWDTKGKPLPINKTPLGIGAGPTGRTHSHPICCLGVTGTTNSNHIISLSSDGVLCSWSLANLSKPVKRIELKKRRTDEKVGLDEIGALCMGTQETETSSLLIGSDDSDIYQVSLLGSESSENVVSVFKGHNGPVHSVNLHPGDYYNNVNFSHLFISSSADWTTKLWTKNIQDTPLLTFDACDDYVYCSKWHPRNPSVFATGDGSGMIDFWDLNKDLEMPIYRHEVGKTVVNQLCWSSDGKRLAYGDYMGKVAVLGVDKQISHSKAEDSLKFEKVIAKLKINK